MNKVLGRLRCSECNSLRVVGDRLFFKCRMCGFVHDARFKAVVKPPENVVEDGLVCKPNIGAWFVEKKGVGGSLH